MAEIPVAQNGHGCEMTLRSTSPTSRGRFRFFSHGRKFTAKVGLFGAFWWGNRNAELRPWLFCATGILAMAALCKPVAAQIENIRFYLPSEFSSQEQQNLGLEELFQIELKLREGECNDAVAHLCNTINSKIVMRDTQRKDAKGVTQNTQSVRWLNSVEAGKQGYMDQYRDAQLAVLASMGLSESPDYPILKDEDTYAKNLMAPRELGDSKYIDSSISRYGQLKGLDDQGKADFLAEGVCNRAVTDQDLSEFC
ncbi:hypothetical protein PM082_009519 [Marasmius tenuissimus]|nr:hypothetical protein PM082_009519 [Marasmius tenuissimus]